MLRPLKRMLSGGLLLLSLSACPQAGAGRSEALTAFLSSTVTPGVGIGEVRLNSTTLSEVTGLLGEGFERTTSSGIRTRCVDGQCSDSEYETVQISYPQAGTWFEFENVLSAKQDEANLPVQRMAVACDDRGACPFTGQTVQGLHLKDPREKVESTYGSPGRNATNSWLLSYPSGIGFGITDGRVTQIQVGMLEGSGV
ncbi:MAG: hypothetical protein ACO1RX_18170 [Candidatus Sericytochromatia bacterium]